MYVMWLLDISVFWVYSEATYKVICNAWVKMVEGIRESVNVVTDIFCRNMYSYIQRHNTLRNSYHIDTPVSCGDVSGEDEFVECDVNNDLDTASESINGDFVLGGSSFDDSENDAINLSKENSFLILGHQYKGLSSEPKQFSGVYQ